MSKCLRMNFFGRQSFIPCWPPGTLNKLATRCLHQVLDEFT